jgi:hypothetical protein
MERDQPRRKRRTFRPDYLSFAPTYQCNLSCPHCCVPIEWTDRLDVSSALSFLEQCHGLGITRLGFTGGEPFLCPDFLVTISRRAAQLGFRFDKLMTNGVWFEDDQHLRDVLSRLRDSGFSGKIGLSVDKFHGIHTDKLARFCRLVREIFASDTILSLSYASRTPHSGLEPIQRLAQALNAVVEYSPLLGRYLLVSDSLTMTLCWNHLALVERAEKLPGQPWDGIWFEEDYCEGPGQALIVNPRGDVKPCCGFASDLDQLTIGNIYQDDVRTIIRRARRHPVVGTIFRHGLSALRDQILAENPYALPGATSNHCYFCWYILTRGLVRGVPGGGGQVGRWVSPPAGDDPKVISLGTDRILSSVRTSGTSSERAT